MNGQCARAPVLHVVQVLVDDAGGGAAISSESHGVSGGVGNLMENGGGVASVSRELPKES